MSDKLDLPTNEFAFKTDYGGRSLSYKMAKHYDKIISMGDGNKIRVVDDMETYTSDTLAAAAWVASDTVATTGVVVTSEGTNVAGGSYAITMTTGSSSFSSDVTVTKTLTASSSYLEDIENTQDWREFNFLGFIAYAGAATAATDIDVYVGDKFGNWASTSLGAIDSNYAQDYIPIEIKLDEMTGSIDWSRVKYLRFVLTSTMGTSETYTVDDIIIYKYSNGYGPVLGNTIKLTSGADSLTRGMIVKAVPNGMRVFIDASGDGDEEAIGILCTDGDTGDDVYVQIDGYAYQPVGEDPSSWEAGDGLACAGASGAALANATSTMADAFCRYIAPLAGTISQYGYALIQIGNPGATPSA